MAEIVAGDAGIVDEDVELAELPRPACGTSASTEAPSDRLATSAT
jgi:hypothetical protein